MYNIKHDNKNNNIEYVNIYNIHNIDNIYSWWDDDINTGWDDA